MRDHRKPELPTASRQSLIVRQTHGKQETDSKRDPGGCKGSWARADQGRIRLSLENLGVLPVAEIPHVDGSRARGRAAVLHAERANREPNNAGRLGGWRCGGTERTAKHIYLRQGTYNPCTLAKRFGGWTKVPEAFREFAKGQRKWADVVALLPARIKKGRNSERERGGKRAQSQWRSRGEGRGQQYDGRNFVKERRGACCFEGPADVWKCHRIPRAAA